MLLTLTLSLAVLVRILILTPTGGQCNWAWWQGYLGEWGGGRSGRGGGGNLTVGVWCSFCTKKRSGECFVLRPDLSVFVLRSVLSVVYWGLTWVFCIEACPECCVLRPDLIVLYWGLTWVFCIEACPECCVLRPDLSVLYWGLSWVFCIEACPECCVLRPNLCCIAHKGVDPSIQQPSIVN